jgi:class 3 adenylate cyclase
VFNAAQARARQSMLGRCSYAFCLAELGQRAAAAAEFEQLATGDFALLPNDGGRMAMMILLAEVCTYLHDADRAAVLYRMLLPYADRNATLDIHVCYGAVSHYLGMLATVTSAFDRAEAHFEAALAFNDGMGATLWETHTRYRHAEMLFERDRAGDHAAASALAEAALATAESLGMKSLVTKLRSIREANPSDAVTILFTDMEDSAGMTERLGDVQAQELIRVHNAIVREQVAEHQGVEVKTMGDGFMIAFSTSHSALLCAIAIQRAFAAYNERHPDACISLSIGLHTGQAIREGRDFFGKTVILAARIRAHARGGEILISAELRELAEGGEGVRFGEAREVELKGLAGTHRVHAVLWNG